MKDTESNKSRHSSEDDWPKIFGTTLFPNYHFKTSSQPAPRTRPRNNAASSQRDTTWHFPENDDYPESGKPVLIKLKGKKELTAGIIRYGSWVVLGISGVPEVIRWRYMPSDDFKR